MNNSGSTRVFHIDTNLGTATGLLKNQGACGWFEGQWWYISSVGIHGRADTTFVKVSIVPQSDGPNGRPRTDVDALLICAKEQFASRVAA